MLPVTFSIAILLLSSLFSALFHDEKRRTITACAGVFVGSVVGLAVYPHADIFFKTAIPNLTLSAGIDDLTRFFLIVIFGLSSITAVYGYAYIKEQKRYLGTVPFFPLLVASMAAVTVSRDGLSFLVSWEIMSLSSYFLVISEHENKDVQNAGWIYLIATHLATAFLMAFFILLARENGSLLFKDFISGGKSTPFFSGMLFIFALIGFGTKAGIFPLHLWLPHAHPKAPSYISALMSGVMIKTGIYGCMRAVTFLGRTDAWWGILLIVVGIFSAILGVLYALQQHDLKRLLAYHSVENIGIIAVGIGLGIIGYAKDNLLVSLLGFGGALFHVLNHSIFKGLLFLGAGAISHTTHTLSIDDMGGLFKKLPLTGFSFLIASLSICGLPPFNGFISEWLIYIGLFKGSLSLSGYPILILAGGIVGIAFAGGLAVACFTKAFGIVFLGEPRKIELSGCSEPSRMFIAPMLFLAFLCLIIGIAPGIVWPMIVLASKDIYPALSTVNAGSIISPLAFISLLFSIAIVAGIILTLFKKRSCTVPTWDCGYAKPTAKMQYTAVSFAEPISFFFKPLLDPKAEGVEDMSEKRIFSPIFKKIFDAIIFLRKKRKSTVQYYLILIFITLITLFIWEVWFGI